MDIHFLAIHRYCGHRPTSNNDGHTLVEAEPGPDKSTADGLDHASGIVGDILHVQDISLNATFNATF